MRSVITNACTPTIIFEDTHLIVLSKPAGLLSQGEESGDPNLVDWLREYLERHYVGLIHRLDRNTSGIMLVAKRTKSAQRLTEALQAGRINRSYLGWVKGHVTEAKRWSHWLLKDGKTNIVRIVPQNVVQNFKQAKIAVLFANPVRQVIWNGDSITLIEFTLETGRSHQIRVQCASEGSPLLGDKKYGQAFNDRVYGAFQRTALHSYRLEFEHPMSGEKMKFEAPLPEDMGKIANK